MADATIALVPGSTEPSADLPFAQPVEANAPRDVSATAVQSDATPTAVRSPTGQFLPGEKWDGNAKGRAKGVKNRITLQRLLVEERLRDTLGIKAEDILKRALEMAMGTADTVVDGKVVRGMPPNDKIMRTLLDKLLATPKNSEDGDAKDNSVQITINDLSGSANPKPVATISRGPQTLTIPRVTSTETGDSDNA